MLKTEDPDERVLGQRQTQEGLYEPIHSSKTGWTTSGHRVTIRLARPDSQAWRSSIPA